MLSGKVRFKRNTRAALSDRKGKRVRLSAQFECKQVTPQMASLRHAEIVLNATEGIPWQTSLIGVAASYAAPFQVG